MFSLDNDYKLLYHGFTKRVTRPALDKGLTGYSLDAFPLWQTPRGTTEYCMSRTRFRSIAVIESGYFYVHAGAERRRCQPKQAKKSLGK
jgi:hypothetical protein